MSERSKALGMLAVYSDRAWTGKVASMGSLPRSKFRR